MLVLATTAGGPSLAGLLWDMTGSYAVTLAGGGVDDVWRSHTADPVVGFRLIMPDARSSR